MTVTVLRGLANEVRTERSVNGFAPNDVSSSVETLDVDGLSSAFFLGEGVVVARFCLLFLLFLRVLCVAFWFFLFFGLVVVGTRGGLADFVFPPPMLLLLTADLGTNFL